MSDERDDRPERREIKVTDKRMFTPEGELREEYRDTEARETGERETGERSPAEAEPRRSEPPRSEPRRPEPGRPRPAGPGPGGPGLGGPGAAPPSPEPGAAERPPLELPETGPGPQPSFFDLLGILAEPAAVYLGDAQLPDGSTAENLDAARLHIDLLDVLRRKTAGNLTAQESAVLEDVLYRLRMRYVQKRG